MDSHHLPCDWSSTDNYLEGIAFLAKEAVLVIDEFVPTGSHVDRQRLMQKADRVLRAQGNGAARGRMKADGTLRPARPPRGLIVATGEEMPAGQSLRARLLTLEISPGDIPVAALTVCQKAAAKGEYAAALSGFIEWLAPKYGTFLSDMPRRVAALRETFAAQGTFPHGRTAGILADLDLGVRTFLAFAVAEEALSVEEAREWQEWAFCVLLAAGRGQGNLQKESEPTGRFLELLQGAIASGRCHVASQAGGEPHQEGPASWGWDLRTIGAGENERTEWKAKGDCVGYVNGDNLYLLPDASFEAAQRMAIQSGDSIAVMPKTLSKRLHEKGMLMSVSPDGLTVKISAGGQRVRCWHIHRSVVQGEL